MMRAAFRFAGCFMLLLAGASAYFPAQAGSPAIAIDGERDAAYGLFAEDLAGDLQGELDGSPVTAWTDLTALYTYSDSTHLYVFVPLSQYTPAAAQASGQIGLVIEATGADPDTGGAEDAWSGTAITYAYTSTVALGQSPSVLDRRLLPDGLVRGQLPGQYMSDGEFNDGSTELYRWQGAGWSPVGSNWGGITGNALVGDNIAYSNAGVELRLAYADMGLSPGTSLRLQFFTTRDAIGENVPRGAYDTVPSDSQAYPGSQSTTLNVLAGSLTPPPTLSFATAAFSVSEPAASAPVTVSLSAPAVTTVTVAYSTRPGTATLSDFEPVSGTLTFLPGSTSAAFTVPLLDDALPEPAETILCTLTSPSGASLGTPASAVLTLYDDDSAVTPVTPTTPPPSRLFLPLLHR